MTRLLLVCARDPKCVWSRIKQNPNDLKSDEAQAAHHARHDYKAMLDAKAADRRRVREALASAARQMNSATHTGPSGRASGEEGSALSGSPKVSCACCALGIFGQHGVGHVTWTPRAEGAVAAA